MIETETDEKSIIFDEAQEESGQNAVVFTVDREQLGRWGLLPLISVWISISIFMLVIAYQGGRELAWWAEGLAWIAKLGIFVPAAVRLFSPNVSREERIGILLVLGIGFYLVKLLYSPLDFKFVDELQHVRTAEQILQTGRLFDENTFLEISVYYPGLELVTAALVSLTGLSVFSAGAIVVGVAKLVFVLAMFLFYEKVSGSSRISGIATAIYMTNPHFEFFNSSFAYQSLGLTFGIMVLLIALMERSKGVNSSWAWRIMLVLCLLALTMTHHLSNYAVDAFLLIWLGVFLFRKKLSLTDPPPAWITAAAVLISLAWVVFVAQVTFDYLYSPLKSAVTQVIQLITNERSLSSSFRPPANPLSERIISLLSVGLIASTLPFGLRMIWKKFRANALAVALGVASLGYYASLTIRLTERGAELTGRSWSFLFLPVAFVLAVAWVKYQPVFQNRRRVRLISITMAVLLFVAGITSGWPPYWARLPGPYLVSAYERSIGPEGIAAAQWVRNAFGPNNRVAADFTNRDLMGTYGMQSPVYGLSWIYFLDNVNQDQVDRILQEDVDLIVVDYRLTTGLPLTGYYFEAGEPDAYQHSTPMDAAALNKFDQISGACRVYDSGNIVIYYIGASANPDDY